MKRIVKAGKRRVVYLEAAYEPNGDVTIDCPEFKKSVRYKADGESALFARMLKPFVDTVLAPHLAMPGGFIDLKIKFDEDGGGS